MILSASSVAALCDYGSSWYFFDRQLIWAVGGAGRVRRGVAFDYHRWRRVAPCVARVSRRSGSSSCSCRASASWSTARGAGSASARCSVQPSEIAKLALLVLRRRTMLTERADRLDDWRQWTPGARDLRACSRLLVMLEPDLASTIVLGVIWVRAAHRRRRAGPAPRADDRHAVCAGAAVLALLAPLPPGAHVRVPAPVARPANTGYQICAVADRDRQRRRERCRPRRRPREVVVPAQRAHRLHLRDHRRGARPHRLPARARAVRRARARRLPRRAPRARPVRHAARRRRHRVDRRAGRDQPRRGRRAAAGVGDHAAVPVGGRIVARDHDVRRGDPRQRRAPDGAVARERVADAATVRCTPRRRERDARPADNSSRREPRRSSRCSREAEPVATRIPAIAVAQELQRGAGIVGALRRRQARHRGPGRARGRLRDRPARRAAACNGGSRCDNVAAICGRGARRSCARSRSCAATGRASSWDSAATRRSRASLAARAVAGARRSCTNRTPRPGSRTASACGSGARPAVSLPDTPLPERDAHRQSGPAGDRARSSATRTAIPRSSPSSAARRVRARSTAAALGCYDRWRDRTDLARAPRVRSRATSTSARARSPPQRRAGDALRYELVAYEEHMDDVLRARDARGVPRRARARSPSSPWPGVPAVLVPLPGSPSDHQTRNAQTLERAGAAVMVPDAECDPTAPRRGRVGAARRARPARADGAAARGLGRPDAAARLADLVEEYAGARADVPRRRLLDLSAAAPRAHRRASAGVGMSAIALVLARMGQRVSGSDIKERGRCSTASRPPASTCTSATGPSTSRPTPTRSCTRPRSRVRNVELVAARELGIPVLHRVGRARRARRHPPHHRGRRLARQDHHLVDARAHPAQRGLVSRAS